MNQNTIPVNLNRTHRLTHRLVEIVEWVQLVEVVISMGVLESVVMEMEMAESVEANRESMEAEVESMAVVMEMETAESAEAKGESVEVLESVMSCQVCHPQFFLF